MNGHAAANGSRIPEPSSPVFSGFAASVRGSTGAVSGYGSPPKALSPTPSPPAARSAAGQLVSRADSSSSADSQRAGSGAPAALAWLMSSPKRGRSPSPAPDA